MPAEPVDLRDLDPPEPMLRILAMVESGAEGPFAFLLRREPFPLYPLLRGTGWTCSIRKEPTAFVFTVTRDPGFLR